MRNLRMLLIVVLLMGTVGIVLTACNQTQDGDLSGAAVVPGDQPKEPPAAPVAPQPAVPGGAQPAVPVEPKPLMWQMAQVGAGKSLTVRLPGSASQFQRSPPVMPFRCARSRSEWAGALSWPL